MDWDGMVYGGGRGTVTHSLYCLLSILSPHTHDTTRTCNHTFLERDTRSMTLSEHARRRETRETRMGRSASRKVNNALHHSHSIHKLRERKREDGEETLPLNTRPTNPTIPSSTIMTRLLTEPDSFHRLTLMTGLFRLAFKDNVKSERRRGRKGRKGMSEVGHTGTTTGK